MRIFALQTKREKTIEEILSKDEVLLSIIHYSGFIYLFGIVLQILITVALIAIGVLLSLYTPLTVQEVSLTLFIVWILFALFPILSKYIHWFYSFVMVTKERIVIIDQVSIVHREITELSLENFSSVAAETQFWNLFPFGILHFTMREGTVTPIDLHYVPHADAMAKEVSEVVTAFQGMA